MPLIWWKCHLMTCHLQLFPPLQNLHLEIGRHHTLPPFISSQTSGASQQWLAVRLSLRQFPPLSHPTFVLDCEGSEGGHWRVQGLGPASI